MSRPLPLGVVSEMSLCMRLKVSPERPFYLRSGPDTDSENLHMQNMLSPKKVKVASLQMRRPHKPLLKVLIF